MLLILKCYERRNLLEGILTKLGTGVIINLANRKVTESPGEKIRYSKNIRVYNGKLLI